MNTPLIFWDVDTQVDFVDPGGALYVPGAELITDNLERLTRASRSHCIPVIAGADDHEMSDAEISVDPNWETTFPPHCIRGSGGALRVPATYLEYNLDLGFDDCPITSIHQCLRSDWPRVLIHKKGLDAFSNPNTDTLLQILKPQEVVVYGVALEFCVRKVIEGLLERGQTNVVAVTDAMRAMHQERIPELFENWSSRGVRLATTDSVLRQLETPQHQAVG